FSVGVSRGLEPILHAVNQLIEDHGDNVVSRCCWWISKTLLIWWIMRLCYRKFTFVVVLFHIGWNSVTPARLYYGEHTLRSCQGVQQGDPLGPLIFALVLHPLVCKIRDSFSFSLQAWYLPDGTIIGDTLVVGDVLKLIIEDGPHRGLHLNVFEHAQRSFDATLRSAMKRTVIAFGPKFGDAKVTVIEEAKDLATLPLKELIKNLKVYEMVLDNDDVASKTTMEKVKYLALKAKVTRDQTSDNSDSEGESDEDIDEEKAEAFNLLARNFRKGNRFERNNRFDNGANRFGKGRGNSFKDKGGENSKKKEVVSKSSSSSIDLNIIYLQKENEELLQFNKDFTKTFEKLLKGKRALEDKNLKLASKINDLEIEVNKLVNKEVVEPCQKCVELIQEVDSLTSNVSKLQDEALNFSKFKSSSIALDDMLSRQKISQDKEGLGFSKK
ncbi:hypothetical protein Tco_0184145, partial [Tanacetum coccineum]